jgi:DNA-directed RNA polymerase subunit RPC12/RpoP
MAFNNTSSQGMNDLNNEEEHTDDDEYDVVDQYNHEVSLNNETNDEVYQATSSSTINNTCSNPNTSDYKCGICFLIFPMIDDLDSHVKGVHQGSLGLKCKHCTFYATSTKLGGFQHLKRHMKRHHPKKKIGSVNNQRNHTACYQCGKCDERYPDHNQLKNHINEHYAEKYQCTKCPSRFAMPTMVMIHESSGCRVRPNSAYTCKICGTDFSPNETSKSSSALFVTRAAHDSLMEHMRQHLDNTTSPKMPCDLCDKDFEKDHDLFIHRFGRIYNL